MANLPAALDTVVTHLNGRDHLRFLEIRNVLATNMGTLIGEAVFLAFRTRSKQTRRLIINDFSSFINDDNNQQQQDSWRNFYRSTTKRICFIDYDQPLKKILGDAFIGRFEDMLGNCNQLRELYFYHFPAKLLTALHNNNQNNEAIIPRLQQVSVKLELTH